MSSPATSRFFPDSARPNQRSLNPRHSHPRVLDRSSFCIQHASFIIRRVQTRLLNAAQGRYHRAGMSDDVGKLQKEIRSLKKQVERLEASRATFELMVDRNDKLLSRQLEQTQKQAEALNRINLLADSALDLTKAGFWHLPLDGSGWHNPSAPPARIYGHPPSPEQRYHEDFWAANVRAGDEAAAKVTMENLAAVVAGTIP